MRRHSCTKEDAKDVFQQSIMIFYENIIYGKVKEITSQVKTYLFSIGKNKILELSRQKSKQQFTSEDYMFSGQDIFYNDFDDGYEEKIQKIELCISKIGDPCKKLLVEFYYHKRSMIDIAEIMDYKNSDTVKNLKYKCLKRLKQVFQSDFGTLFKGAL
jgi:RNA polymerase sigma-70 factor (ECF subfamily)